MPLVRAAVQRVYRAEKTSEMAALAIPVHDLDSSGKDFVFALDEAWLHEAFRDTGVRGGAVEARERNVEARMDARERDVEARADARERNAVEARDRNVVDAPAGARERNIVEVHAQRNGSEVLVHGRAHVCLVAECVRCLKDLPIEVSCELAALYSPTDLGSPRASTASAHAQGMSHAASLRSPALGRASTERASADEELEVDPDAPDRETYSGDRIVIDDLVRDYLLLELPMQPRCELGWDCPNLELPAHMRSPSGVQSDPESATHFGEGAIDPRLMPLQKLARREPDKE